MRRRIRAAWLALRRRCPECEGYGEVRAYSLQADCDIAVCRTCGGAGEFGWRARADLRRAERELERYAQEYDEYQRERERAGL